MVGLFEWACSNWLTMFIQISLGKYIIVIGGVPIESSTGQSLCEKELAWTNGTSSMCSKTQHSSQQGRNFAATPVTAV